VFYAFAAIVQVYRLVGGYLQVSFLHGYTAFEQAA
jgi:hypothetical protein